LDFAHIVRLEGVHMDFGTVKALREVRLTIARNEIVGLIDMGRVVGDEEWELSLTYGQAVDTDNLVVSGTLALAPGLDLAADLAGLDNDSRDPDEGLADQGLQAVSRHGVAF
jgi:hypothetical protein